ncbi:MAG: hypothetical protein J6J74_03335 [Elusimicrobiaceae bacterium]|nr:hypothetical protein [Elusimicrobiaceae bacterium]
MKKLIPLLLLVSASSISYAESMKFITVLSSPVGTFNKLEAVDPAQPAKGNTVNFCTNIGTQGVVELKGTKPATLTTVVLSNNTTLGKTDEGKFSLSKIELHSGGSIKGGRLFGNTVTVNNAASGKANNLYGNELTIAGAKTKTLDVGSGKSKINNPGDSTGKEELVWSNEYQSDTACGNTAACAKQYLLKEKGSSCAPDYSAWISVSSGTDTCPGADSANEFTCDGSFVGTCTDIRSTSTEVSLGQTSTRDLNPPAGYEMRYSDFCFDSDRLNNTKIAVAFDGEYVRPTINYACASCSDISSGYLQDNLPWGFHLMGKNGGVVEWVDYGTITDECQEGDDGAWSACRSLCGVDWNDTKGCKTKKRCYQKSQYNNTCGNLTACRSDIGNGWLVITCDVGAGGTKYLFKLKQCGGTMEKRTVTCCA